ncbi:MAG: carotenoid oxygenase family protein, partial [Ilumatobacteraceae bacterium]
GHPGFDGDGMIHSVEFAAGDARYRNRFVQTEGLAGDRSNDRATFADSFDERSANVAASATSPPGYHSDRSVQRLVSRESSTARATPGSSSIICEN